MMKEKSSPSDPGSFDFDLFISYPRDDAQVSVLAKRLASTLEDRGVRCWMDTANLEVGSEWSSQIKSAIDHSEAFLVLVSNLTSSSTPSLSAEWSTIQQSLWRRHEAAVLPITVGPTELPSFLSKWQALHVDNPATAIAGLTQTVTQWLTSPVHPYQPEPDRNTAERFREIERALVGELTDAEDSADE